MSGKIGREFKTLVKDVDDEILGKGRVPLWPALIVFVVFAAMFSLLSEQITIGKYVWLVPIVLVVLIIPFGISWFWQAHQVTRFLGRFITGIMTVALAVSVFLLVASLPSGAVEGAALLRDAAILWAANVLVFGLWYWEIDGNGPGIRHLQGYTPTDFLFPQILAGDQFSKHWSPQLIDYVYLAFNTSTAFSPTDTSVLSRKAKVLMMCQSILSLIVIAMLAARAINILPTGK